jgi:uncharacterized lipoprotein YddW (UPF0748 family)
MWPRRIFLILFCIFVLAHATQGQELPPKREFRAAWVCTLANLDWPSKSGSSSAIQQQEFRDLLNMMQGIGLNALIVQVRPAGDAFYPSEWVPWSQYLSGKQGVPPNPYYDPLAFMVQEAHSKNMEFHAWFNPFRALSSVKLSSVAASNVIHQHPEWFFNYGESKYFDPGIPAVRDYLIKVILEVVENYDIDGVHLDDYFYPYPVEGQPIPDERSFRLYGQGYRSKDAWRRANVDAFISELSDTIFQVKPWVKFGISPFGVWRSQDQDGRGSATSRTFSAYDGLYADTRKWLEYGWVDYMAPQLYWNITHSRASFKVLLDWWSSLGSHRHIYAGHGVYLLQEDSPPKWATTQEYMQQVRLCRSDEKVCGSIWFRANTLQSNTNGIREALDRQAYPFPALVPCMPWIDSVPPLKPTSLAACTVPEGVNLSWEAPGPAIDGDVPTYYVVYRFKDETEIRLEDPRNIVAIRRETNFLDKSIESGHQYTYCVTALDRSHNESLRAAQQVIALGMGRQN